MDTLQQADYISTERRFYENVSTALGEQLLLYCVTGSLARNEIIPGWSDIDILLVVARYDAAILDSIRTAVPSQEERIKIGVSIFSLEEFNNRYFKDSKTYISISLINQNHYKPRIIAPDILLQEPTTELRHYMNVYDFARFGHDLKRELLRGRSEYDEKKTYKTLVLLLKIMLYERGSITLGYSDTLRKSRESLGNFLDRFIEPTDILALPGGGTTRYDDYVAALEWIKGNTDAIFR